jgi:hypothetical protein
MYLHRKYRKTETAVLLFIVIMMSACCDEPLPTIVVQKNDDTYTPAKVLPVLEEWQHATFRYFYDGADPSSGMAYEGNERGTVIATGGSGFGMMALVVGAERGWITREQAADRVVKMFRFLDKAERFKGMWSHWYNPDGTAHPFGDQVKTLLQLLNILQETQTMKKKSGLYLILSGTP